MFCLSSPPLKSKYSVSLFLFCFLFCFFFLGDQQTIIAQEVKTKKPVIIQVTEGHGSAVFSLVHLELLTDDQITQNQDFDTQSVKLLQQSTNARISMLSQILELIDINCQPLNAPELTPIFLLARKLVSV